MLLLQRTITEYIVTYDVLYIHLLYLELSKQQTRN